MPTLTEELAAVDAKLVALLPTEEVTEELQLTAQELLKRVADEFTKPISKARTEYLRDLVAKTNFEGTNTYISIKVVNDPLRVKESTENIGTILSVGGLAASGSNWAYNSTTAQKAALITKLLQSPDKIPEYIEKSSLTDKLDDIKTMFSLSDSDLKEEYDLRWKVGELIGALQTAVKLERLVGVKTTAKNDSAQVSGEVAPPATEAEKKKDEEGKVTPPVGDPPTAGDSQNAVVWPNDMTAAKFDTVAKAYKKPEMQWGPDNPQVSGR